MRAAAVLLAGLACAIAAVAQPGPAVRVVLITAYPQMTPPGLARFERDHGPGRIDVEVLSAASPAARLERAQVICFVHNSTVFSEAQRQALERAVSRGAVVTASFPDLVEQRVRLKADTALSLKVEEYWKQGGAENIAAFFALVHNAKAAPRKALPVNAPLALRNVGVYHPSAPRGLMATLEEYLAWYRASGRASVDAPVVGVTFFHTSYKTRDLAHIDALIEAIEKGGMIPAAMCGWPPAQELPKIFDVRNHPLRVLFVMNYNFAREEDARLLETVNVPAIALMTTRQAYKEWEQSPHGVPPEALAQQVAAPERAGGAEPIVIATSEQTKASMERYYRPIPERIQAAVARARRWLVLQRKPNAEKRLAMLYYNNPAGKGGIGASYLNVPGTIRALLDRLQEEGYDTGGAPAPAEKALITMLERSGRNIEVWAPGELERMVSARHTVLVGMEKYRRWFAALPAEFRAQVLLHWGPPEQTRLMTIRDRDGVPYFVVPGMRFGNVFLGPQPLKSSFEEASKAQHNTAIPPPHAYIAAYLWYRHEFAADAMIHLGRHGTLEFLPGKNVGQAGWDSSEVLLGDLPNAYYYIMDGGGESTIARRRSAGVLIGHLTPMVAQAGEQAEFDELRRLMKDYEGPAPESLKAEYEKGIRAEIRARKLDGQLGLDLAGPWDATVAQVQSFLEETEAGAIPLGIHVVGQAPREELQQEAAAQFVRSSFRDPASAEAKAAADNWLAKLRMSPAIELDALPRILSGRFQPSGMSGDPLRTPEALTSGRNLHDFDPSRIPTKEACTVGKRLAEQMLTEYKGKRGAYPEKISMVLWYGETARHLGVMECQAMNLLGVEPVWNSRGVPDKLRLIPVEELKRPRIDVVYTLGGIYRDGFPDKVLLLDKATQLVAAAEGGDNAIARNTARIAAALRQAGVDEGTAVRAARARAFAAAPGDYGAAIARIAKQSKDQDGELVSTYLSHMGHAYSSELWGQSVPKALSSHLEGNQVVLNSRSSSVYGVLDNDDFFEFTGGLNAASRAANGGVAPEFLVADVRRKGGERVTAMKTYLATELNARFWNPKWIAEMQRGGYSGARELADNLENLYGWQATSKELMDGAFWQNSYDVYVKDKHGLGMKQFFAKESPHARQAMLARLLEVDRQGSYRFSAEDRARLVREFVRSVNEAGTACSANVCGNRRLRKYALDEAKGAEAGLPEADRKRFEEQFRASMQADRTVSTEKRRVQVSKSRPERARPNLFDRVRVITAEEWARLTRVRPFGIPPLWFLTPLPLGGFFGWWRRRAQGRTEAGMRLLSLSGG